MKASDPFKEAIKAYLDKRAEEDELFAVTYQKENKNFNECCNYVMQRAKEAGCNAYHPDEVFGWAVHYYDEDDIKNVKPVSGQAVVGNVKKTKSKTSSPEKPIKEKPKQLSQPSLFDI